MNGVGYYAGISGKPSFLVDSGGLVCFGIRQDVFNCDPGIRFPSLDEYKNIGLRPEVVGFIKRVPCNKLNSLLIEHVDICAGIIAYALAHLGGCVISPQNDSAHIYHAVFHNDFNHNTRFIGRGLANE